MFMSSEIHQKLVASVVAANSFKCARLHQCYGYATATRRRRYRSHTTELLSLLATESGVQVV